MAKSELVTAYVYERVQTELRDAQKRPANGISFKPARSMLLWSAKIEGPPDTPYEGGIFFLNIKLPTDYPFKPPNIHFTTKIYHPNITTHGMTNLSILWDTWSTSCSVSQVLFLLKELLEEPNADEPLNLEAATLFQNEREEFGRRCREMTKKYATLLS
jgi:ubiquitin-conjugating enzyme E2 D/E